MKKSLLTLALAAATFGMANATVYTHTFAKGDVTAAGKVNLANNDANEPLQTVEWDIQGTTTTGKTLYFGFDTNNNKGVQLGSSGSPMLTLSLSTTEIPGNISEIKINTSGAKDIKGTFSVKVGDTAYTCGADNATTVTLTKDATEYTFTGDASGKVEIAYSQTSSMAIYVKSISITYEEAVDPNKPTPVVTWKENTPAEINVGENLTLTEYVDVTPAEAATYMVYSSSNTDVAAISDGIVEAKKRGVTTISVYMPGNDSYNQVAPVTFDLTVVNPNLTSKVYKPVTDVAVLTDGTEIIIGNAEGTALLGSTQASNNRPAYACKANEDGTYTIYSDDESVALITLGTSTFGEGESATSCYTFHVNNGAESAQGYLYAASSGSNWLKTQAEVDDNAKTAITITETEGVYDTEVKFLGTNTRNLLRFNKSSNLFSCYANGQNGIQLYYYEAPAPKQEVTLAWSAETAEAKINIEDNNKVEFTAPTLTVTPADAEIEVAYASSNEAVATVAADGTVTVLAEGTTVITASFAGNDAYEAATPASYTLTVSKTQSGIEAIGADADAAVYFDLQGRRVANPEKGLYIKREGTRVSKVIL